MIKSISKDASFEKNYDKLVIATGSKPNVPKIYGTNADNFFKFIDINDAMAIKSYIEKYNPKNITIMGLNQISLNLANELIKNGFSIDIVDSFDKLLTDFDDEFNFLLGDELNKLGIKLYLGNDYLKFIKNDANLISKIEIRKHTIETQMVIYTDRLIPDTILAKNAGIDLGIHDGIVIDNKMKSNDDAIYACGAVTEISNLVSKERELFNSLNLSEIQGRVAGSNVAGIETEYKGMLKTNFYIFNKLKMAVTGLNISQAQKLGHNASTITIYNGNYERFIPGSTKLHVKIVFDNDSKKYWDTSM